MIDVNLVLFQKIHVGDMKKLLMVMVLWCNVGFASANIYLVCPIKITTDNSFFGLKKMHQGSNNFINQFYINIKTSSSSIKMNYYAHVSPDGVFDWQNIKPTKSKLKFKGYVEDDLANVRVPLS